MAPLSNLYSQTQDYDLGLYASDLTELLRGVILQLFCLLFCTTKAAPFLGGGSHSAFAKAKHPEGTDSLVQLGNQKGGKRFTLYSDDNGSLPSRQIGATRQSPWGDQFSKCVR